MTQARTLWKECDRSGGRLGCQKLTLWTRDILSVWEFADRLMLVSYRLFGTTYRCQLQKSSSPRSFKMGHIGCPEKSVTTANNAAQHHRMAEISVTPRWKPVTMQNYEILHVVPQNQSPSSNQQPSIKRRINVAWRMCTTHFIYPKTQKQRKGYSHYVYRQRTVWSTTKDIECSWNRK